MISCTDAIRQLWEYIDGLVDEGDRARVEEHLALCLKCCGAAEFAQELSELLARSGLDELPEPVRHRLGLTIEELTR